MTDATRAAADALDPHWGADLRREWPLHPDISYLNHGGFGVTPYAVLAAQERWRAQIEADPTGFLSFAIDAALREAAAKVAATLGAAPGDLVFVDNATTGLNAVLRSLDFEPGDEILITSLSYPAIRKAVQYRASRSGARVVEAAIKLPVVDDKAVLAAIAGRLSIRTKLAIFDHVASHSALVLPVASLTRLAQEAGARVVIDGAHAPGMIPLDIASLGAEWYVGNLHKWYFAPRSCGFLWAAKQVQAATHPLAISHGYGSGFRAEFEWTGTRDVTPALAAPAAIDFHTRLGGGALMARNRDLARAAGAMLAQRWGTELTGPRDAFAAMVTIRLPLPPDPDPARAGALMKELGERHRIAAAVVTLDGALWLRIAAQAYNEANEYDRLGALFKAVP
jgi:isopenicillin-N epimerase